MRSMAELKVPLVGFRGRLPGRVGEQQQGIRSKLSDTSSEESGDTDRIEDPDLSVRSVSVEALRYE